MCLQMATFFYLLKAKDCPNLGSKSGPKGEGWNDAENGAFLAAIRVRNRVSGECDRLPVIFPEILGKSRTINVSPEWRICYLIKAEACRNSG